MAKRRKSARGLSLPARPLLMGLGFAAIVRDKTYDLLSQAMGQASWLGKPRDMQKKLLTSGQKEYARLARDVERSFASAMKGAKKMVKSRRPVGSSRRRRRRARRR